ncbi:hydrogenase maturation protease [Azonexus fungiphilus]|uniref:hydrogenase maturation protease n=1 Tax=Azonexus fungiphilus TaxID=146940 RepID=UPI00156A9EB7|nr:hydrogenase maturation protease [Azonexus fungiphilus]
MSAPVVVFAVGNPSRGDDAIGPLLCGRLAEWLKNRGREAEVELIEDFQLNIEHALDLEGRSLALFIDAAVNQSQAVVFRQIGPSTVITHSTHALPPEAVLQVYRQTEGREPPPAFTLAVRGEAFALGQPPGAGAEAAMDEAMLCLVRLLANPRLDAWQALAA